MSTPWFAVERAAVFDLTMFGSDEMVRVYNALYHHIYTTEVSNQDARETMRLRAAVLLAIRTKRRQSGHEAG